MKEDVEKARASMTSGNLNLISQRSVYLQDVLYKRLDVLCAQWNMATITSANAQKLNNSAVLRVLLEMMMPFLMVIDDVPNEGALYEQLEEVMSDYFNR